MTWLIAIVRDKALDAPVGETARSAADLLPRATDSLHIQAGTDCLDGSHGLSYSEVAAQRGAPLGCSGAAA